MRSRTRLPRGDEPARGRPSTGTLVRHGVEHSIRARRTPPDTASRAVEDELKRVAGVSWRLVRRHPYLGTAAIGAGVVVLASSIGAAELGLGAIAAYAAFQVLRGRERPEEAMREVIEGLEHVA